MGNNDKTHILQIKVKPIHLPIPLLVIFPRLVLISIESFLHFVTWTIHCNFVMLRGLLSIEVRSPQVPVESHQASILLSASFKGFMPHSTLATCDVPPFFHSWRSCENEKEEGLWVPFYYSCTVYFTFPSPFIPCASCLSIPGLAGGALGGPRQVQERELIALEKSCVVSYARFQ